MSNVCVYLIEFSTIRERHESAVRLKLENGKMTAKRQVLSSVVPEKLKGGPKWPLARARTWDPLEFCYIHSIAKGQKIEGRQFVHMFEKLKMRMSHSAKKSQSG